MGWDPTDRAASSPGTAHPHQRHATGPTGKPRTPGTHTTHTRERGTHPHPAPPQGRPRDHEPPQGTPPTQPPHTRHTPLQYNTPLHQPSRAPRTPPHHPTHPTPACTATPPSTPQAPHVHHVHHAHPSSQPPPHPATQLHPLRSPAGSSTSAPRSAPSDAATRRGRVRVGNLRRGAARNTTRRHQPRGGSQGGGLSPPWSTEGHLVRCRTWCPSQVGCHLCQVVARGDSWVLLGRPRGSCVHQGARGPACGCTLARWGCERGLSPLGGLPVKGAAPEGPPTMSIRHHPRRAPTHRDTWGTRGARGVPATLRGPCHLAYRVTPLGHLPGGHLGCTGPALRERPPPRERSGTPVRTQASCEGTPVVPLCTTQHTHPLTLPTPPPRTHHTRPPCQHQHHPHHTATPTRTPRNTTATPHPQNTKNTQEHPGAPRNHSHPANHTHHTQPTTMPTPDIRNPLPNWPHTLPTQP